ncbi:MAG: hypothetical protein Q4D25_11690 [Bacteroidales bacterium]|nr:hypothetical protein [Bacteroidales bacterium]
MKLRFFLLVIVALVLLTGCERDATALLERAEACLPARLDSAEVYLDSVKQIERLNDVSRAWYGLLRAYTDNRQGKEIKSDSLIRDSYEYYREASHAGLTSDMTLLRRYAQSCYYMALFYESCDSTKQCEDLLNQSIKGSEKCEDWHTCYLAYIQLGSTTRWGDTEYAIQQSLKALDTYHKINDDVNNEVLILAHLATKFLLIAQPDSALNYYYKAYELAEKNHLVKTQNEMCMGLASTYCYISDNEKALDYARRGIITADSTVLVTSLVTLAQCYFDCDSLDKAKDILRAIPCQSDDYINKYLILRNLSEIAFQKQEYDSLFAYEDSAYECLEDRFFHAQQVKDEYYQANLAKELEKEQIQHEAERNVWILVFSIVLLVLLALFIYNVLKNKIAVERHKRLNHLLSQRVEHTKHLQEQQEKEHVIMENEKEIQHQRDIIRQKAMTLSILQKLLLEKLHHMSQTLSEAEKIQMTRETWTEMEQLLNATDNGFVARLRQQHKDFKEEDIHLCMLIRLKMNNTVVSNIYNIGVDAVKKRKLNLKKNGFKVSDSSIRLEDVIDNL